MAFQLDQLRTLLVLVEEGTFDAAAGRLRVTASAISQRVKAMEQAAGQILVQRTNPVVATAAGDIVLRLARQVQVLEHDTETELARGIHQGGRVSIALAVNADSLATWFLEALAVLTPTVDAVFDLVRDDQEHTTALLRSGTVMAAITSTAEPVQGCTSTPLGIMRYRAVCSTAFADRWLTGGVPKRTDAPEIRARFADAPVVNFDRKDELQHDFLRTVMGIAARPPRHYVPTSSDFARAVVLGLGWALLPEQQCLAELRSGALIELAPDDPVDVQLYWQRWNLPSPLLDEISAVVHETARGSLLAL